MKLTPDLPFAEPLASPLDDSFEPAEPDVLLLLLTLNEYFPSALLVFCLVLVFVRFYIFGDKKPLQRFYQCIKLTTDLLAPEPTVLSLDDSLESAESDVSLPFLALNEYFPPALFFFSVVVVLVLF